jgi:hypothetical protein
MYGVDVPGGALLAVLHDKEKLDRVRRAAASAAAKAGELIKDLPPLPAHDLARAAPPAVERKPKPKRKPTAP